MLDGYAPPPEEFENLPWARIRASKGLPLQEWVDYISKHQRENRKRYRETSHLTAYRNAVRLLLTSTPAEGDGPEETQRPSRPFCLYHGFTTGHTHGSMEASLDYSCLISRGVRKALLPVLQREKRHDEQEDRLHYIQHVVIYPGRDERVRSYLWESCSEWADILHFEEKSENAYVDLNAFAQAWSAILSDMSSVHERCSFYRRLYERLGIGIEH